MNNKEIQTAQFAAITLRLTPKSIMWLNDVTQGVPHLTIYRDLLFSMATSDMSIGKRGIDVQLKPLEVEASANGLGNRWHLGRKVMTRLLNEMEQLGMVRLSRSKLTSIATMTSVIDYDAIPPTTSDSSSSDSQAEQQNVAQPSSGDDVPEAIPTVPSDIDCHGGTSASNVAEDPPSQVSVPTTDTASNDPIDMPDGGQSTISQLTMFGEEDELL